MHHTVKHGGFRGPDSAPLNHNRFSIPPKEEGRGGRGQEAVGMGRGNLYLNLGNKDVLQPPGFVGPGARAQPREAALSPGRSNNHL